MRFVTTLISDPKESLLNESLVRVICDNTGGMKINWLAKNISCDIYHSPEANIENVRSILSDSSLKFPFDWAVQPVQNRRKMLLVADMDSTIIEQECIDELAAEVGLKDKVASITERAMNGEIAFEPALRERVELLKGLNVDVVERVLNERITLTSGAIPLVKTMKAHGAYCALVSGGFTLFAEKIASMVGFDESRANHLIEQDGCFVGKVTEPILGQEAKLDALNELTARLKLDNSQTIAVGDGANDLQMLKNASAGVAFRAKPAVAKEAGIRIDAGDLTSLLYMQGYKANEFSC